MNRAQLDAEIIKLQQRINEGGVAWLGVDTPTIEALLDIVDRWDMLENWLLPELRALIQVMLAKPTSIVEQAMAARLESLLTETDDELTYSKRGKLDLPEPSELDRFARMDLE